MEPLAEPIASPERALSGMVTADGIALGVRVATNWPEANLPRLAAKLKCHVS